MGQILECGVKNGRKRAAKREMAPGLKKWILANRKSLMPSKGLRSRCQHIAKSVKPVPAPVDSQKSNFPSIGELLGPFAIGKLLGRTFKHLIITMDAHHPRDAPRTVEIPDPGFVSVDFGVCEDFNRLCEVCPIGARAALRFVKERHAEA